MLNRIKSWYRFRNYPKSVLNVKPGHMIRQPENMHIVKISIFTHWWNVLKHYLSKAQPPIPAHIVRNRSRIRVS